MTTAEAAVRLAVMDQVLILTHVRPDGDTIGSAAALCCGLRTVSVCTNDCSIIIGGVNICFKAH